jgi:hypothetical protein
MEVHLFLPYLLRALVHNEAGIDCLPKPPSTVLRHRLSGPPDGKHSVVIDAMHTALDFIFDELFSPQSGGPVDIPMVYGHENEQVIL